MFRTMHIFIVFNDVSMPSKAAFLINTVKTLFVTAADSIPPLGFQQKCQVEFYDQEEPTRRIPNAPTCALTLYLPRGVLEEEEFRELMFLAIKGSLGFGKV